MNDPGTVMIETNRPFPLGILLGRFQTLHKGHVDMIERALAVCDRVGIFVGSAQESGTSKNPFSFELRKQMLERVFGDRIAVLPLKDIGVGNNSTWGDYVLDNAEKVFGRLPDLFISGKENRRTEWLMSDRGVKIAELIIPKTIEISATVMRQFLIDGEKEAWQQYAPEEIWPMFDILREAVLLSKGNNETQSI